MNNKENASFWKKRSAAVAVVICFVAAIAGIGTYTFRNSEDKIKQQVKKFFIRTLILMDKMALFS